MDPKSRCLWLFSEHCFHTTYSNIPVAEVSCVCSDILHGVRWIQLIWTQIILPKPNIHRSVKWKLSNSSRNPHLRYRLPIGQCWRLGESVKLCVLQGHTDDYSSWSFGQCWIQYHCQEFSLRINVYYQSGENTSPNRHHSCNVVIFFIWDYFAISLLFI